MPVAPNGQRVPAPLVGAGWGGGSHGPLRRPFRARSYPEMHGPTPLPSPPPQGGRESAPRIEGDNCEPIRRKTYDRLAPGRGHSRGDCAESRAFTGLIICDEPRKSSGASATPSAASRLFGQTIGQLFQSPIPREPGCGCPRRRLVGERGERRRRIHRGDRSKEAKHRRLSGEEAGGKDAIKRPVTPHQVSGAFWTDPGGARAACRKGRREAR